jgi:hypothetical protein
MQELTMAKKGKGKGKSEGEGKKMFEVMHCEPKHSGDYCKPVCDGADHGGDTTTTTTTTNTTTHNTYINNTYVSYQDNDTTIHNTHNYVTYTSNTPNDSTISTGDVNVLSGNEVSVGDVLSGNQLLSNNSILSNLVDGGVLNNVTVSEVLTDAVDVGGIGNNVLQNGLIGDVNVTDNVIGPAISLVGNSGNILTDLVKLDDVLIKPEVVADILKQVDVNIVGDLIDNSPVDVKILNELLNVSKNIADVDLPVDVLTDSLNVKNVLTDIVDANVAADLVDTVSTTVAAPTTVVAAVLSGNTIAEILNGNKVVDDVLQGKIVNSILDAKVIADVLGGEIKGLVDLTKFGVEIVDTDIVKHVSDIGGLHAAVAAVESIADLGNLDNFVTSVDLFNGGDLLPDFGHHHG